MGNGILKTLRGKNAKNKKIFLKHLCNIFIISIVRDWAFFKGWGSAPLLITNLNYHFHQILSSDTSVFAIISISSKKIYNISFENRYCDKIPDFYENFTIFSSKMTTKGALKIGARSNILPRELVFGTQLPYKYKNRFSLFVL